MSKVKALVGATVLTLALAVPVTASQDTPGTPGDANCDGQTIAYLAQAFGAFDINGIGNLAKALGVSVKDVQAIVDSYCG